MSTPKGKVYAELAVSALSQDHYFLVTSCASEFHDLRCVYMYVNYVCMYVCIYIFIYVYVYVCVCVCVSE